MPLGLHVACPGEIFEESARALRTLIRRLWQAEGSSMEAQFVGVTFRVFRKNWRPAQLASATAAWAKRGPDATRLEVLRLQGGGT